jgi:amino acid permease
MLLFDQPIFFLNLDFNVAIKLLLVEMLSKVVFVFFCFFYWKIYSSPLIYIPMIDELTDHERRQQNQRKREKNQNQNLPKKLNKKKWLNFMFVMGSGFLNCETNNILTLFCSLGNG